MKSIILTDNTAFEKLNVEKKDKQVFGCVELLLSENFKKNELRL